CVFFTEFFRHQFGDLAPFSSVLLNQINEIVPFLRSPFFDFHHHQQIEKPRFTYELVKQDYNGGIFWQRGTISAPDLPHILHPGRYETLLFGVFGESGIFDIFSTIESLILRICRSDNPMCLAIQEYPLPSSIQFKTSISLSSVIKCNRSWMIFTFSSYFAIRSQYLLLLTTSL